MLRSRVGNGIGIADKTGITDKFDWDLKSLSMQTPVTGGGGLYEAPGAANVPRAPTIFVALEEQLGLRLEPVQVPREYFVIDAVETRTRLKGSSSASADH